MRNDKNYVMFTTFGVMALRLKPAIFELWKLLPKHPATCGKNISMKNSISMLMVSFFALSTIFTSCTSPAQKVENAQNDVTEAEADLVQAQADYLTDVENYRMQKAEAIAANNQSIEEFNARIEQEKKAASADYKMKISELEQKNSDMKKRLDDYKTDTKEQWEAFKTEFNRDMDQLVVNLNDLVGNKQ